MLDECGLCGLLIDIHPRYRTLEALATARERDPEAHSWVEPGAAAAIRAQADEAWRNDLSTNWRTLAIANQAQVEEYRTLMAAVTAERDDALAALDRVRDQARYVLSHGLKVTRGDIEAILRVIHPPATESARKDDE